MSGRLAALAVLLVSGCTAEIPTFDDDPRPEVCGGSVCFPPDHVAVRRWADGEVTVAAWRGTEGCALPQSGNSGDAPIAGHALIIELHRAQPGARLAIIAHDRAATWEEPYALVRAVRVDPQTGRALADEQGVSGELTVLDLDSAAGHLRVRIRARWSSGVSGEQQLDIEGWPGCAPTRTQQLSGNLQ